MRVRVLYFAAVRDLVGRDADELELPEEVRDVRALAAHLESLHEPLRGRLAAVRFALDESFADGGAPLHDGATVALIPPVAGG